MSTLTVRPMTPDDDLASLNGGNGLAWQAVWWQELTATMDIRWFTGLVDGVPAGFAAVCPLPVAAGGYGGAVVNVVPTYRRRGLGTALRERLASEAHGLVPGLLASHVVPDGDSEAAVAAWGLPVLGRHVESVLDLTALDRSAFTLASAGEGLVLSAELPDEDDETGWRALHAFVEQRFGESPDMAGGGGELPYDTFRSMAAEPGNLLLAYLDDALVGVTLVTARPGEPLARNTFFTGVAPQARGRGVATALKSRHALMLSDRGVLRLLTQNMEGNTPILAANRRLGFRPTGAYVDVGLALG